MGDASGADVAYHPVGSRDGQAKQEEESHALDILILAPLEIQYCHCFPRRFMNLSKPCARSLQAGHSPQP